MKKIGISVILTLAFIFAYAEIPDGYYDNAEGLSGTALKTALYNIIRNHQEYSYNALRDYILKDTDEDPNNSNNVILLYTGWSYSKDNFGGNVSQWNREHVWAKSHGDFGTVMGPGTDAHHIRPTDVTVNSRRGNLDFDNGGSLYIDGDGSTGCYVDANSWEPRDEVKGDVARMIFYMAVRYEGDSGEPDLEMVDYVNSSPNNEPYHGKEAVLFQWHLDDPVSQWEIDRNDKVYSYQNNRNPFIDHPDYVGNIWLGTEAEDNLVHYNLTPVIYPNPFQISSNQRNNIMLSISAEFSDKVVLDLYNIRGRLIESSQVFYIEAGENQISLSIAEKQASGIYFIEIKGAAEQHRKKIVIIR